MLSEQIKEPSTPIKGTDLWVPAREAYVAFGGDLDYDVVLVIGFDGINSPLLDARFTCRPDRGVPATSTQIRTILLDHLVRKAISENRTAYRHVSPTRLVRVSPEERQASSLHSVTKATGESRRRITDDQLRRVADVYLTTVGERRNPTRAVEEQLRLQNRNVAKKWVQKARAAGFLAPSLGERRWGVE